MQSEGYLMPGKLLKVPGGQAEMVADPLGQ
jgi:hypothetical protein